MYQIPLQHEQNSVNLKLVIAFKLTPTLTTVQRRNESGNKIAWK